MAQASEAQTEHLSSLFVDCGFTLHTRKEFLKKRFGREIVFLDQLTKSEASKTIDELKDLKDRKWNPDNDLDWRRSKGIRRLASKGLPASL